MEDQLESRACGTLLGLACGDALGRPVEFRSPHQIERTHGRITEMLADGTYGKPAGTITDDTEMALCITRSLAEHATFDPADVADRFVAWKASGPFDIGIMTANALRRIQNGESWDEAGRREWESGPEGSNAGNGSLMRCAPYAIAYRDEPDELVRVSRRSSTR
ncbi:ADP-ribosylglycohydrolase family protein [Natronoglomus mannanivorans]|uniref:ADP-ribosylglycohydrolase family protein n=1 Tax=Natronoglomus mannanivorans TaxID=2979990 RepID=UPI003082962F